MQMTSNKKTVEINSSSRAGKTSDIKNDIGHLLEQGYFEVVVTEEVVEDFLGARADDGAVKNWQEKLADQGLPSLYHGDRHVFVFRSVKDED